ncbi:MAG: magnesium/cobalt transporter CorA [Nitrosomonadales bacterium]|nr:MAG: magnesium/cobalt transporter CorA [Nitrosomonadales bacterium]
MKEIATEPLTSSSEKAGLPPGTLVHVGKALETETRISVIEYDGLNYKEYIVQSIDKLLLHNKNKTTVWINIEGLTDTKTIESIGQNFGIHPLVLEDILNTNQRPRFEDYGNYLFIVLKALLLDKVGFSVNYEQTSIIVMENIVITFKEKQDNLFEPIKHRLSTSKGRIRVSGADYLAYAILDIVVDQYMIIGDSLVDVIEGIESELLANPSRRTLASIQSVKREAIFIRKTVSPVRELLVGIQHNESTLIQEKSLIYFRDVYDHSIRVIESMDSYRELVSGLLDIYLSSVSNKMNETMKVLTIFASIFIPLTFISGIYGMNFEYMPELKWKWSYPLIWIVFIIITVALLIFFKKKKWF